MNLARFLKQQRVDLDLDATFDEEHEPVSLESLTGHMCDLLVHSEQIVNPSKLRNDLVNRERRAASLLGQGVFMPHVRTLQARRLVIAVGISNAGLDLPTPDDQPVRLVVALVGPSYDDKLYLQVYKQLSDQLLEAELMQRVLAAGESGEVVRALSS